MATEPESWDVVEAVYFVLTDTPQTPSTLARKAKVKTYAAQRALAWMVGRNEAAPVGNGAWTKYRLRQAGEYPARADKR